MTDFIAQTKDGRNISYIDDEPESVWRRAEFFFGKGNIVRVVTQKQLESEQAEGKVSA